VQDGSLIIIYGLVSFRISGRLAPDSVYWYWIRTPQILKVASVLFPKTSHSASASSSLSEHGARQPAAGRGGAAPEDDLCPAHLTAAAEKCQAQCLTFGHKASLTGMVQ
jgi:hypothetical protein